MQYSCRAESKDEIRQLFFPGRTQDLLKSDAEMSVLFGAAAQTFKVSKTLKVLQPHELSISASIKFSIEVL